jgi:hypothetical protein
VWWQWVVYMLFVVALLKIVKMEYCGTNQILFSGVSISMVLIKTNLIHHSDFHINLDVNALIITSTSY